MNERIRNLLRQIPSMDELLGLPWVPQVEARLGREAVKDTFAEVLGEWRLAFREGTREELDLEALQEEARSRLALRGRPSLRRVLNGTGVVVHTNLGRSPLPPEALDAVIRTAQGYSTLEYSLEEGRRGHRNDHVEWLLSQATGAEKGLVVNNNAAAVLLCLAGLAAGKEVVVSRGELVEIGGSFRIPDILAFAGARMVEVGTTNRTRIGDYAAAVTDQTALLLKVHPSNFRIQGFHEAPSPGGAGGPGPGAGAHGAGGPGQRPSGASGAPEPHRGTHRAGVSPRRGGSGDLFRGTSSWGDLRSVRWWGGTAWWTD